MHPGLLQVFGQRQRVRSFAAPAEEAPCLLPFTTEEKQVVGDEICLVLLSLVNQLAKPIRMHQIVAIENRNPSAASEREGSVPGRGRPPIDLNLVSTDTFVTARQILS
jgi:hypothetical protein